MSYILHIDTATERAHVSLAKDGLLLQAMENDQQKDHAAFVQTGIQQLLYDAGISFEPVAAIAVTAGPGSYTGLRVGMASAKGLCYALNKPLIAVNTLEVMAKAAQTQAAMNDVLYCPMIDARRMEVFTAIYSNHMETVLEPAALIVDENSYSEHLQKNKIHFFGSGSSKWQQVCRDSNAVFINLFDLPAAFTALSYYYYNQNKFSDLAYSEPYYIKEFKTNT
ncbi:MAG: tRNA (adenosine(37)-N6)-threonylcarbamoyltransferase complex dimerization subunit type 1 TsaB [Ferruginibacter sp.]